jgi:ribosomal protein S18 acetylase RimI-like enzyme
MSIKIRTAKKNDIPLVLGLLYELGRPKPEKDSDLDLFRNLVKKQIADSDKTILIAEKNDVNVVGLVSIVFLPRLNQIGHELYIPELIVTEKYRNQGIGTMLINACVSLAKQKGCKKLRLESGNKRRESHKFYEDLGFESKSLSFTKNLVD